MVIIGVDPGNEFSAITLYNGETFRFGKFDNAELFIILDGWLRENEVKEVFIEGLQMFGMSVGRTVFETAYMVGGIRMWLRLKYPDVAQTLIHRSDVKMHHCQSMRAKDTNIRQAIIDRFGEVGTKKNPGLLYGCSKDMWSSTAIAVMGYDWQTKGKNR